MIRAQDQKGFTLIEVVIVTFLFSVLLLGLMSIYDWHQKVYLLEQADVRATGSVRTTLNEMSRYIAQGDKIIASRTIAGQTYNTGGSTLILEIPSLSSTDNVIPNTFDYVTYYVTGTVLYQIIEIGTGSNRPAGKRQLSSTLNTLSFTYNNSDPTAASKVVIDIIATAKIRAAQTISAHAVDTIFLRNR